jgi:hypothetical protein
MRAPAAALPSRGRNRREATRDALIESVTVTLRGALDLNREDALAAAGDLCSEAKIGGVTARHGRASPALRVSP